jgi:hypothetical protein
MYPMADITTEQEKTRVEDYISSAKNFSFFLGHIYSLFSWGF